MILSQIYLQLRQCSGRLGEELDGERHEHGGGLVASHQQRQAEIHHLLHGEAPTLCFEKLLHHVLLLPLLLILPIFTGATGFRLLVHPLPYHLPKSSGHLLPRLNRTKKMHLYINSS